MTHIPDHLQGDSPLARWWVALEGVRAEIEAEAPEGWLSNALYHISWAMTSIEEEGRS